jgi:hypothetical protein
MESRLRKLLSPRRSTAHQPPSSSELDLHSVPYTTTPSQSRLPVFIHHALGKTPSAAKRKTERSADMRTLSYHAALPGKPPEVGHRPQRGNGPVKLQTSRRLSSGELLVTQQDYDRTLEDIRQGEYIVGGERRASQTPSQRRSTSRPPDLKLVSSAPNSPRAQSFSPLWPPPSAVSENAIFAGLPPPLPAPGTPLADQQSSVEHINPFHTGMSGVSGLGISSPPHPLYSRYMPSTTSLLEPHEEQNPTIQALWKAEYGRLVSIYGQAGVDRNIADLNQDRVLFPEGRVDRRLPMARDGAYSSTVSLQQTLQPLDSAGRGMGIRNYMSTTNLEVGYRDDHSEGSSNHRHSLLSSSGASSSFTTRTSMAEEPTTTRDDLRRIVDDMRMTYLHAIEAHTPPLPSLGDPQLPLRKPHSKQQQQTRSLASSVSVESGLRSISRQSHTKSFQSTTASTATPRTSVSSPHMKPRSKRASSRNSRRASAQHVVGVATLSSIQASPARSHGDHLRQEENVGLKRADSTTLGSLAKNLTILDTRVSNASRPTMPSSPAYNPSSSESVAEIDTHALSQSLESSPLKNASLPRTPQKPDSAPQYTSPGAQLSWHREADRLFEDAELDLALNIEDFESLCDDLFNSPVTETDPLGRFRRWPEEGREDSDTMEDGLTTSSPSKASRKLGPTQAGLQATGLPMTG